MSTAETEAAQVMTLIEGSFNAAGLKAQSDPNWPSVSDSEWTDGTSICSPEAASGGTYPAYCLQALVRRSVNSLTLSPVDQIPIRVVWKATSTSQEQATYGWILVAPVTGDVLGLGRYNHWCVPDPSYDPENPVLGPCKLGS